ARERLTTEIDTLLARSPVEPGAPGADIGPIGERWSSARLKFQALKSDPESDLSRIKAEIERVMAGYAAVARALAASPPVNDERPWTRAVRNAADAARDARADRLIESLQADPAPAAETFAAAVAAAAQQHAAAADAAKAYAAAWLAVENALNQAFTLDETAPGGKTVKDLIAEASTHPLHAERPFADAVQPVSERAAALPEIAAVGSLSTLRDRAIGASRATPEYVVAIWQRLGRPGLTGDAWLEAQIDVFRQLDNLGGPISADRKTQIIAAARRDLPARWLAHFAGVQDSNEVERCMLRRADFAVADADLARLPGAAKFNWRLSQLKEAVRGPDSDEKDAAVKRAVESLLAEDWGNVRAQDSVRQVLESLKAVLEGKTPVGVGAGPVVAADADPNQIGPALAGWAFVGAKGDVLTYELKPPEGGQFKTGGPAPRLDFVRLTAPGPDGAPSTVYLCTTEASLRLVIEVVDRANAWGLLRGAFTANDADRALPFVWQWPGGREAPMVLTEDRDPRTRKRSWIGTAPILASKSYYPAAVDPGEPSLDSPVQYVTPSAAGFIARLVNCRLPSGAEWTAALDAEPGSRDPALWNLRDQTFNATAEHVRKSALTGLTHPDYRSFEPPIADRRPYDHDDRTMWFATVGSDAGPTPRRFKHLVGNVAELVFEKPELFNGMRVGAFDAVDNIINKQPENRALFLAAGGSALSARLDGEALFKPQAIKTGAQRRLFQYGCADLGFRLAFTPIVGGAVELSFSQRVDKVIQPAPYAAPAQGSGR
ncbi:MAG: hypothetical protein KIT68_12095, partial [Phycisphaeraceae bacterium]|nr:hypothetical protein [Phycisphaeraceae bacterium]